MRIAVLGPISVTVDGADSPIGGPTQRRLVAALAVAALAGAVLTATDLIDEVYHSDQPVRPRRSLATIVWRLRRRWGSEAIVSDGETYQLAPAVCRIDADEFEQLLGQGRSLASSGDHQAAITSLQAALAIWRGQPEPEPTMPAPERLRLVELRLGAMDQLAQSLSRCGQHSAAIELLERVVTSHPEWEHSQAQLIQSHLTRGDLTAAGRVQDSARRYLADQGVEPGQAIQAAVHRLNQATLPVQATHPVKATRPANPTLPAQKVRSRGRPEGRRQVVPSPASTGTDSTGTDSAGTELVGRTSEVEQIIALATRAIDNRRPEGILVSGEPGIGKTAVTEAAVEHLAEAPNAPRTVTLHCDPRRTLPYAPLIGLADLAADLPAGHEPLAALLRATPGDRSDDTRTAGGPDQIRTALANLVADACRPNGLVLLVEDLHWAHPDTRQALTSLLDDTVDLPLVIIATSRDSHPYGENTAAFTTSIRLPGLAPAAIAEIIGTDSEPSQIKQLHRLTGGNPLYAQQLRRAGLPQPSHLPEDLEAAIGTHLRHIPAEVLHTLEIAAVVGDRFDVAVLAGISGETRQARPVWIDRLTAATRSGLVHHDRQTPGHYTFVHTLIREHLYHRMSAQRRTAAHAEIGRTLDRIALVRPCPADLLVHHFTRGWPETSTREVVHKLGSAARAAIAQLDFAQAADHYRAAVEHLAMDPVATHDDEVADTIGAAGRAAAAAGDLDTANGLFQSQLTFADSANLPAARLSGGLGMLHTQHNLRARPQIAENLAATLAGVAAKGILHQTPDLAAESLAAVQVHSPHRATELLATISRTEPTLVNRMRRAVWEHRTVAGQLATAQLLVDDPDAEPISSWLRLWVSEVGAGLRALDDPPARRIPLNRADDQTRYDLSQWRVTTATAMGQLERANRLIDKALAAPPHPDPAENARRAAGFYGQRTRLALITGKPLQAQRSPEVINPTWVSRHPIMRYVSVHILAVTGQLDSCRELRDDLIDEVDDADIPESDLLPRLALLADACLRTEHSTGIELCLTELLPHRGEQAVFLFGQHWGAVNRTIGNLQVALGDVDAGIESIRNAIQENDRVHATLHQPEARRDLGNALQRRGRPGDHRAAEDQYRRADTIDRALGITHRFTYPE